MRPHIHHKSSLMLHGHLDKAARKSRLRLERVVVYPESDFTLSVQTELVCVSSEKLHHSGLIIGNLDIAISFDNFRPRHSLTGF